MGKSGGGGPLQACQAISLRRKTRNCDGGSLGGKESDRRPNWAGRCRDLSRDLNYNATGGKGAVSGKSANHRGHVLEGGSRSATGSL